MRTAAVTSAEVALAVAVLLVVPPAVAVLLVVPPAVVVLLAVAWGAAVLRAGELPVAWAAASASTSALQVALDYACGYSGVDCSAIQTGGSCFNPDTIHDHASYAFNSYYQKNPLPTSCDFGGTATITTTDPSSGSCQYPASSGGAQGNMMPPPSPTTLTPTTPMTPTPMTPFTPTPMTPDTPSTGTPMYGSSSPPDFGSMSPPGPGSNSPPDYSDVGAAPATTMGRATLALVSILAATLSMSLAT
ncbi:unnamed protein product [Triticum turgidum subsp. durum]|uniref:X8 domain-containing protein n=1 Tax=Triticum turgidum subsp. durum TaxID=4567 RepID=A0A9R1S256_TRITD|nr:unnamed protein product [Triticum turgidum subsp. durum]